jgi:hypothetical protein
VEKTLTSLCTSLLEDKSLQGMKPQGLVNFLFHKPIEEEVITKLISKYNSLDITSFKDYIYFLKKFISLIIAVEDKASLINDFDIDKLIDKMEANRFFEHLHITEALRLLIYTLLDKPCEYKEVDLLEMGGMLLSSSHHYSWAKVPHLQYNCEVIAILAILGAITSQEKFDLLAKKAAKWHLSLLDNNHYPFMGLWTSDHAFDDIEILCSNYLMFYSVGLLVDKTYIGVANSLLHHINNIIDEKKVFVPSFPVFMAKMVENIPSIIPHDDVLEETDNKGIFADQSLGLLTHRGKDLDTAISLFGVNAGIASIHCKDVHMRSIGPQYFPLNDSRGYGTYRLGSYTSNYNDIDISSSDDEASITGWTRLCRFTNIDNDNMQCEPSDLWFLVKATTSSNQCLLDISCHHQNINEKIAFSCFVQAKTCHVGERQFLPNSLERYASSGSETISMRGKGASVIIKNKLCQNIFIIPLGSDKNYWNSDFLVAFEIGPNVKKCLIEVTKA